MSGGGAGAGVVNLLDETWTGFEFLHMEMVNFFLAQQETMGVSSDQCYGKLEFIGFRIGQKLIEKLTKDRDRLKDELEIMKYVCKEFWYMVYKKNIDNLKTNHQGVYVLTDKQFRFIRNISNSSQFSMDCLVFTAIPCGVIRGALDNIGVSNSTVLAEISTPPEVKFTVTIPRSN